MFGRTASGNFPSKVMCGICVENMAKSYCFKCKKGLCEQCERKHDESTIYGMHSCIEIDNFQTDILKCKSHLREQVECYCTDCGKALCQICVILDHNGHNIGDIADSLKSWTKIISLSQSKSVLRAKVELGENNKHSIERAIEQVKGAYNDVVAAVRDQKRKILCKLDEQEEEIIERFTNAKNDRIEKFEVSLLASERELEVMQSYHTQASELAQPIPLLKLLIQGDNAVANNIADIEAKATRETNNSTRPRSNSDTWDPVFIANDDDINLGIIWGIPNKISSRRSNQTDIERTKLDDEEESTFTTQNGLFTLSHEIHHNAHIVVISY